MKRIILSIFVIVMTSTLVSAESCSNVGKTDKKYTPVGTCDYKTETRTCCDDKQWSEWNKECENHDGLCWNGHEYRPKPVVAVGELNKIPPGLASRYCGDSNCSTPNISGSYSWKLITPLRYKLPGNGIGEYNCTCIEGKGWDCPALNTVTYSVVVSSAEVYMGSASYNETCGSLDTNKLASIMGINLRNYGNMGSIDPARTDAACRRLYSEYGIELGRDYRNGGSPFPLSGGWMQINCNAPAAAACSGGKKCQIWLHCSLMMDDYILSNSDKDYLGLR